MSILPLEVWSLGRAPPGFPQRSPPLTAGLLSGRVGMFSRPKVFPRKQKVKKQPARLFLSPHARGLAVNLGVPGLESGITLASDSRTEWSPFPIHKARHFLPASVGSVPHHDPSFLPTEKPTVNLGRPAAWGKSSRSRVGGASSAPTRVRSPLRCFDRDSGGRSPAQEPRRCSSDVTFLILLASSDHTLAYRLLCF